MTGFGFGSGGGSGGTEFISMLPPPRDALIKYDNTKHYNEQMPCIPQVFLDAMSVREEVFGEQGVPLEAEFDEDDARSWHWVVYASVATTSSSPPPSSLADSPLSRDEEARRSSATAQRLPVGTIRLIPPPHGPNKYVLPNKGNRHPAEDPPSNQAMKHVSEPYIKLGRLAVLSAYQGLGLSKLLVNTALDYAAKNPLEIRPPPSPTTMELANQLGKAVDEAIVWEGLAMVHAQVPVERLWTKYGFAEELVNAEGETVISKEERWDEEGIEHMAMWKKLKVDTGRL